MAHSEGFELVISVCVANVSAQFNIIDVYDSIVNHFKTTIVCTLILSIKIRGLPRKGGGACCVLVKIIVIRVDTLLKDL